MTTPQNPSTQAEDFLLHFLFYNRVSFALLGMVLKIWQCIFSHCLLFSARFGLLYMPLQYLVKIIQEENIDTSSTNAYVGVILKLEEEEKIIQYAYQVVF